MPCPARPLAPQAALKTSGGANPPSPGMTARAGLAGALSAASAVAGQSETAFSNDSRRARRVSIQEEPERTDIASGDSDGTLSDQGSHEESEDEVDVNRLIENDVSRALVNRSSNSNPSNHWDFERFIVSLAKTPTVRKSVTSQMSITSGDAPDSKRSGQSNNGNTTEGSEPARRPSVMSTGTSNKSGDAETLMQSSASELNKIREGEKELLSRLFATNLEGMPLNEQHRALGRVMGQIFAEYKLEDDLTKSIWSMQNLLGGWGTCASGVAGYMVEHSAFVIFFMLLTVYALFCPDLQRVFGTKETERPILLTNTVVFCLFFAEIVLNIVAPGPYLFTIVFLLDCAALFSILTDTWFMRQDAHVLDDKSSTLTRLARSTRLTRLARIARIARVTRMIPSLIALCMRHKVRLARNMVLRRLWRGFVFLDADRDKRLNFFDLKYFYVSTVYRCEGQLKVPPRVLLREDTRLLLDAEVNRNASELSFGEFANLFLSTTLGKDLIRFQLDDLERDAGIWALIRKVSDRSALKLCVGILLLLGILQIFSTDQNDYSARQGVVQLDVLASVAQASGMATAEAGLCAQLSLFASNHNPMIILLGGRLLWEDGQCLAGGETTMVFPNATMEVISAKFEASGLRVDEVEKICAQGAYCSDAEQTTAVLLDKSAWYREDGAWSLLGTISVIGLLMIYILILNSKITKFSKTLLQPLRALLDDMVALSSLELADIDENAPAELTGKTDENTDASEEVQRLQEAFKTMRTAVRSWCMYVPQAVVQRLFSAGLEAKIGVVPLEATILFCDVEGFENCCFGLEPGEVLELLSAVTGTVADVIQKNDGTLLEFIGDEVLAVFNTPRVQSDHVYLGVVTALQIHQAIHQLRHTSSKSHRQIDIHCRCGVHTGRVFAGNIGSAQRMKYGVLGDAINLTARLKGLNSRYKSRTIVSQQAFSSLGKTNRHVLLRPVDLVAVKGKKEPTCVYESQLSGHQKMKSAFKTHAEGFKMYQARRFKEAVALLEEAMSVIESTLGARDTPCRMLIQRCEGYIAEPPADDWDGVERMTKKSFEDPLEKRSFSEKLATASSEPSERGADDEQGDGRSV
mmetsp:Transcript_110791/g.318404  ORF Transcript_110791/g.318404 Transcript_110791/m.318404 type:complete len:1091 (+) Transcript_110791:44-3316(+)